MISPSFNLLWNVDSLTIEIGMNVFLKKEGLGLVSLFYFFLVYNKVVSWLSDSEVCLFTGSNLFAVPLTYIYSKGSTEPSGLFGTNTEAATRGFL